MPAKPIDFRAQGTGQRGVGFWQANKPVSKAGSMTISVGVNRLCADSHHLEGMEVNKTICWMDVLAGAVKTVSRRYGIEAAES